MSVAARLGIVRLFGSSLITSMVGATPPQSVLDNAVFLYRPRSFEATIDELQNSVAGARAVSAISEPGAWGDLPLVVITAGEGGDPEQGEELATPSLAGRHVVAHGSGHYVQYERPEIVVDAIRTLLELAKDRGS